ncbi:MAG: hypothetical protein QG622_78 [Actinomycetota bacterium]|nr:hypothetical protein [Actinomycetota bacterium]
MDASDPHISRYPLRTRHRATNLTLLTASALVAGLLACPTAVAADGGTTSAGTPGAAGLPDEPLFPTLGNTGYTVEHYDLDLRYATSAPSQPIDGTVTVKAVATQNLSRFNLDFAGDTVGTVSVNGQAATAVRTGEELEITPTAPLPDGRPFTVTVSHFTSAPTVPDENDPTSLVFVQTTDGSAWLAQPNYAHRIFPCNDHPSDKATFSFRIDVPAGTTAVANGILADSSTSGGRTVWRYDEAEPLATELTQVVVGAFTVVPLPSSGGVTLRNVIPTRLMNDHSAKLADVNDYLTWLSNRVGPYPFRSYGDLIIDEPLGYALETQTLSLISLVFFTKAPEAVARGVRLHEASHQWFGNSVTPNRWADVWLSEGHATWYTMAFESENGILAGDVGYINKNLKIGDLTELMKKRYSQGDQWRATYGPVARPRTDNPDGPFTENVYTGGALVLYALQQKIGAPKFSELERQWVTRYRGQSPSTQDFIALATQIGGADVAPFLTSWLYDTTTPPMPGHPDWTVEPATSSRARSATTRSAASSSIAPDAFATRR